jgi:hypothetical protein
MNDGGKLYFDLHEDLEFEGIPEFITLPEKYNFSDVIGVKAAEHAPNSGVVIEYGLEPIFYCFLGGQD